MYEDASTTSALLKINILSPEKSSLTKFNYNYSNLHNTTQPARRQATDHETTQNSKHHRVGLTKPSPTKAKQSKKFHQLSLTFTVNCH